MGEKSLKKTLFRACYLRFTERFCRRGEVTTLVPRPTRQGFTCFPFFFLHYFVVVAALQPLNRAYGRNRRAKDVQNPGLESEVFFTYRPLHSLLPAYTRSSFLHFAYQPACCWGEMQFIARQHQHCISALYLEYCVVLCDACMGGSSLYKESFVVQFFHRKKASRCNIRICTIFLSFGCTCR